MIKRKLLALAFVAGLFMVTQNVVPAYAIIIAPTDIIKIDGGQFVIDEFNGSYTVNNNSTDWYIYAFAVSNPNGLTDNPSTSFMNWNGYGVSLSLNGPSEPVNAYVTADANTTDFNNVTLNTVDLANYIAPGTSAGSFLFNSVAASDAGLLVVNSDGVESQFSSVTPLPAALPLFAGGLGLVGFLARRKRKGSQAPAAA